MYRLEWKESVWSQGSVGRQEMRFFLPLFSTHIMKAHSEKCVGTAVIRISFTWFAWKCVLFTLSWWLYLGLTNSWCRLSADGDSFVGFVLTRQRATNNSAFSAASPVCGGWGGGRGVVMVGVIPLVVGVMSTLGLLHFIVSLCLTINQVDSKHSYQVTDEQLNQNHRSSQLFPPGKKKVIWFG